MRICFESFLKMERNLDGQVTDFGAGAMIKPQLDVVSLEVFITDEAF